jgi:DNA helicase-2/ATP-dependent DNA helicase PcrA
MLQFADSYKNDLLTVVLTNNYRSTQPILDISKTLINRNDERLIKQIPNLTKDLLSSHSLRKTLTHLPALKEYETQRQEMIGITKEVQHLLAEGVPAGKIGIIYKENKYGKSWRNISNY